MVSCELATSPQQIEQHHPKQTLQQLQAQKSLPVSAKPNLTSSPVATPRSATTTMTSPANSATFFASTPPTANSMLDSFNDYHNEYHSESNRESGHEGGNSHVGSGPADVPKYRSSQTYKDRRKNYRLEKKKLADELISAIQDPTIIVMSDWLKVRSIYKQWNKYFCELRPGSLYLYKNQKTHKSSNWIGTVMLKMCELIERPSKKNGFCFKLFHPLEHPIWSPKGPRGEAFTSLMFPLPASSIIFRAPSEEAGRKWMEAIELSLKCSSLLVHRHGVSVGGGRDSSVPTTPLSANSTNGSGAPMQSLSRSSEEDLLGHHPHRPVFNDSDEIEKHFDLCDDIHTDHGEHEDSQEHHTTEDSDEDSFFEDDDIGINGQGRGLVPHHHSHHQRTPTNGTRKGSSCDINDIAETVYIYDGGLEEFGLVGDTGQTEDIPEENKSLLWTLLKQVRPGMDLSKVVLPTFILEPRSFLEKLTDYYYHCDIISKAALEDDPLIRMKLILKWYLSGFYKKPKGLKKPYNPILGETFRCCWEHPETDSKTFYIAEQVSHHPPVSAFYVTNRKDGFCISGSIMAKSKFYGNSISAILEGTAKLSLLARGEDYLITFPYAHCKGIFLGPLAFELGGKITITCVKTNYKTELEFKLKPFFGSDDQCNLVQGKLKLGNETLGTIDGHWDSEITYKDKRNGDTELFWSGIDPKVKAARLRRYVVPLEEQADTESEKLWQKVTEAIHQQNQEAATVEKTVLEEAQREATKQRNSRLEVWSPNLFAFDSSNSDWLYKLAEMRPWDNRTDIKQYEHSYVVRTLTRHLTKKPLYALSGHHPPLTKAALLDQQQQEASAELPTTRSKLRFRRQVTCPNSTSNHVHDSVDYYSTNSKQRSESTSSSKEAVAAAMSPSHQLSHRLDSINSQLNSIRGSLVALERDQGQLKTEINQMHSCIRERDRSSVGGAQPAHHHSIRTSAAAGSGPFQLTLYRVRTLLSQLPTELRQVLLVLIVHLLFHAIYSMIFRSSSSSATEQPSYSESASHSQSTSIQPQTPSSQP